MRLLDQLVAERAEISESQTALVTRAADDARDLSESEDLNLHGLKERSDALDGRIAELRAIQLANLEAAAMRVSVEATDDGESRSARTGVTVISEPHVYEASSPHSFFTDMYRSQTQHDIRASERLQRHQLENEIDTRAAGTTGNFAGLVVPQYLVDLAAEKAQAGRPTANVVRNLPLPSEGMSVNLSRVTTSSSAAVQSAENVTVSDTTIDDTLLTAPVITVAGMQNVSRQAIDRGTGLDQLIYEDLTMSYATALDSTILVGDGTGGTPVGIIETSGVGLVDVDDASPTAAETYQQLVKAIGTVSANRYLPPDIIVMHPRRAAYIAGGLDSNNRPLFQPSAVTASNVTGTGDFARYGTAAFTVAGVPVVTDASIPVNLGAGGDEDVALVLRTDDVILWEVPGTDPAFVQYDGVGSGDLTVRLVAFGYSAFIVRQPSSVCLLGGTLMAATL
jgi:HK97 family phage major capsid protein